MHHRAPKTPIWGKYEATRPYTPTASPDAIPIRSRLPTGEADRRKAEAPKDCRRATRDGITAPRRDHRSPTGEGKTTRKRLETERNPNRIRLPTDYSQNHRTDTEAPKGSHTGKIAISKNDFCDLIRHKIALKSKKAAVSVKKNFLHFRQLLKHRGVLIIYAIFLTKFLIPEKLI